MSSFADVLQQLGNGRDYNDLSDSLTGTVRAVQDTRKGGQITITLKIKPNGEYGVTLATDIKVRAPERPRGETMFFVTADGDLVRNDPRQEQLPLRQVTNSPITPLRTVYDITEIQTPEGVTNG